MTAPGPTCPRCGSRDMLDMGDHWFCDAGTCCRSWRKSDGQAFKVDLEAFALTEHVVQVPDDEATAGAFVKNVTAPSRRDRHP